MWPLPGMRLGRYLHEACADVWNWKDNNSQEVPTSTSFSQFQPDLSYVTHSGRTVLRCTSGDLPGSKQMSHFPSGKRRMVFICSCEPRTRAVRITTVPASLEAQIGVAVSVIRSEKSQCREHPKPSTHLAARTNNEHLKKKSHFINAPHAGHVVHKCQFAFPISYRRISRDREVSGPSKSCRIWTRVALLWGPHSHSRSWAAHWEVKLFVPC